MARMTDKPSLRPSSASSRETLLDQRAIATVQALTLILCVCAFAIVFSPELASDP
jgi:hypothetical protein